MAATNREQAINLLSAAKNHGDLAVRLSSLKQAKEIVISMEPSHAAELFSSLIELQSSPDMLIRKSLVELVEELCLKVMELSPILMPVLMALLRDVSSVVVRQSIVSCTHIFCSCLEEMARQFQQFNRVEGWAKELWMWMLKLKDAISNIVSEPGSVGAKLLAIKFLEISVLLFSSDGIDFETSIREAESRHIFNISWVAEDHPVLVPSVLLSEGNKSLHILLDLLQSSNSLCGSLIISVINCLAAIARKRPHLYTTILYALFGFDPNFETPKGGHVASLHYSLRTAFLGFLRCTDPVFIESRDKLLRALRGMNAGEAADQVIKKVDKMVKNSERVRDGRVSKDDQSSNQPSLTGDLSKKRPVHQDTDGLINVDDLPGKRSCYVSVGNSNLPAPMPSDPIRDDITINGMFPKITSAGGELTPVEQMIAMIGALLAEGERGAESLEILISNIHPDVMAEIVIANMKHLPKNCPPLTSRLGNKPVASQAVSLSTPSSASTSMSSSISMQSPVYNAQVVSLPSSTVAMNFSSDSTSASNVPADYKRDPRRDPRRLDPRLAPSSVGVQSVSIKEDVSDIQTAVSGSLTLSSPVSPPAVSKVDIPPEPLTSKSGMELLESLIPTCTDALIHGGSMEVADEGGETDPDIEVDRTAEVASSPNSPFDPDPVASTSDATTMEIILDTYVVESDQHSPVISSTPNCEETTHDLPSIPMYVEMTDEQKHSVSKLAVERIFESYKQIQASGYGSTRIAILARLVAQIDSDDDIISMLQKHTILDSQDQKGHELALHVLYYLHTIVVSASDEQSTFASSVYEKFLLAVAKSLWNKLPASDKSFSRFLGEVPLLTESALKLLEDFCCSGSDVDDYHERDGRDFDRVTQGLGAVWSLILGRPLNRESCLDIALRCAVHPQDDVRAKAIRLVANKLYPLGYVSENIERFATNMLLSLVDQQVSDKEPSEAESITQRTEGDVGAQETSISGSQNSEPGASESDSMRGIKQDLQDVPNLSVSQDQRRVSLFFALCTKKPSLLQLVFNIYGRSPRIIKQAVHKHIPILLKNIGSSYTDLLCIISDPPQGSENLLMLVLKVLTEETTPSAQLISTVKHLYENKLKDVSVLIPMLSLLSKDEVLPIFPRLIDLPLDKFKAALARILQGSAHTGPALTPAEVLVAIHDINPLKDGIALKKITEACSACFEQRTVFTQQVLAKALNQLVDQTPLPFLFMRTVIQAIDAFPSLVDFVMEILSKLVAKQIWKMPKLWPGFLKCASQTQPHSFRVLLQLPPPQLENVLSKHANLRGPLTAYASQPNLRSSLPSTQRSFLPSTLQTSETSSSFHGTTLT